MCDYLTWHLNLKLSSVLISATFECLKYLPAYKIRFPIRGEYVTCYGPRLAKAQSTLRRRNMKRAIIIGHFGFVLGENSSMEITWISWRHRFREAPFSKCFPSTLKSQAGVLLKVAIYKLALKNKREFSRNLAILSSLKISERIYSFWGKFRKKLNHFGWEWSI